MAAKKRSRLLILSWLAAFSLAHRHRSGDDWPPLRGHAFRPNDHPPVGALVALTSARLPNEWYLAWVLEARDDKHLLESIETGRLCWWSNVGFLVYEGTPRPEWRWTDRQHAFNNKWMRCGRLDDGYMHCPLPVEFGDGWAATVGTRLRWGIDDEIRPKRTVADWRKAKVSDLRALHAECVREANQTRPRAKE